MSSDVLDVRKRPASKARGRGRGRATGQGRGRGRAKNKPQPIPDLTKGKHKVSEEAAKTKEPMAIKRPASTRSSSSKRKRTEGDATDSKDPYIQCV